MDCSIADFAISHPYYAFLMLIESYQTGWWFGRFLRSAAK